MTSTMTIPIDSSLVSLSSPRRSKAASEISKTFKNARDLYLQRRLAEAFSVLKPLVTEKPSDEEPQQEETEDFQRSKSAPIANAGRSTRVKVWSLYATLLNSIIELEPEEGKAAVGSKEWKDLTTKVQDGSIWEDVMNVGYGGLEGNVDADVIINLANLLLAHSPSQKKTQQHLELYLSNSSEPTVNQFATQINLRQQANGHPPHRSGTDTPQDLESKVQIIELYTLHVLPRNGEWEYARDFIGMSEVLDDERRDAFLQTLSSLEDEANGVSRLREMEPRHELEKVQDTPAIDNTSSTDSTSTVRESRPPSTRGVDYGIETPPITAPSEVASKLESKPPPTPAAPQSSSARPVRKPSNTNSSFPSRLSRPPPPSSRSTATQPSLYKRTITILATAQHVLSNLGHHLSQNPMALLRFVLFLAGLIAALSRRDVKDSLAAGWKKVKRTVGMGVKVSYI